MNTTAQRSNDDQSNNDQSYVARMTEGDFTAGARSAPRMARWLALGAVIGPVVFTLAWIILGQAQPGYSFVSQPISALAIGPYGALMQSIWILNGLLLIVGVLAAQAAWRGLGPIRRWACTLLLLISPIGILWTGVFTMRDLALHTFGVQVALGIPVIALPIAGFLLRRDARWRGFSTWLIVGGPLLLLILIGFTTSVPVSDLAVGGGSYGLWQRAGVIEVFALYVALGWLAFRGL